jgi:hypothetical protein
MNEDEERCELLTAAATSELQPSIIPKLYSSSPLQSEKIMAIF